MYCVLETKFFMQNKVGRYTGIVPAVKQAGEILMYMARGPRFKMRLTDICRALGIHKGRAYSILNTLKDFGLVEKDPETKTYCLGPALIFMGGKVLENLDYRDKVDSTLLRLARETRCTAFFGMIVDGKVYVVAKRYADSGVKITIPLGYRFPLTYGAHGKAIVAFLDEEERDRVLRSERLFFYGEGAEVDMGHLQEEFNRCRVQGFAEDIGGVDPRFSCVAAPVLGPRGKVVGSIFIVGTFGPESAPHYGVKVAQGAREVSRALGAEVGGLR